MPRTSHFGMRLIRKPAGGNNNLRRYRNCNREIPWATRVPQVNFFSGSICRKAGRSWHNISDWADGVSARMGGQLRRCAARSGTASFAPLASMIGPTSRSTLAWKNHICGADSRWWWRCRPKLSGSRLKRRRETDAGRWFFPPRYADLHLAQRNIVYMSSGGWRKAPRVTFGGSIVRRIGRYARAPYIFAVGAWTGQAIP